MGALIEVFVVLFASSPVLVAAQNLALDLTMREVAAQRIFKAPPALPLNQIDVDEETWRDPAWGGGEPYRAPRDPLLKLINHAVDGGARYVIVDIVIEDPAGADDPRFVAGIEALASRLDRKGGKQHLLFVRTLKDPLVPDVGQVPTFRVSPLDQVFARHPQHLHMVAPYFEASRDGVLRDWRLWRAGCLASGDGGSGQWRMLPSVQLAIAVLEMNRASSASDLWPARLGAGGCSVSPAPLPAGVRSMSESEADARIWRWLGSRSDITKEERQEVGREAPALVSNRIFYRYAAADEDLIRLSALLVLKNDPHASMVDLRGGITVIGQSFSAAGDQHATPLGSMTGPLVLLNSADSMLRKGLLNPPGEWFDTLFRLLTIVGLSGICALIGSGWGLAALNAVFVLSLFAMTALFLNFGIWVDFSLPLVGILLDQWAERLQHLFNGIGRKGARNGHQA